MKKIILPFLALVFIIIEANAQVKIGDNATNLKSASLLELESTNKGLVFPRVSLIALNSPQPLAADILTGTMVYNVNAALPTGTGIYVWSDSAWVSFTRSGQQALSLINPDSAATLTGTYAAANSKGVFIAGNYAYVAAGSAGLRIINISNPANPILTGTYINNNNRESSAEGVYVKDNYAYVADFYQGLIIVNVSNPANPTFTGTYNININFFTGNAYSVFVKGNYAYVADYGYGLVVINISNPANPTLTGTAAFAAAALGVDVSENFAYLTFNNNGHGLYIIDISNPGSPPVVGTYSTSATCRGVQVRGNYAYMASDVAGLQIINISDPANPILAGTYNTSGSAYGVYLDGNYAYVADNAGGLQIIDISRPANPVLANTFPTSGNAHGVYVKDKYAYVVDNTALQVIKIPEAKNILSVNRDMVQLGALSKPVGKGLVMADDKGVLSKSVISNGLLTADANGNITATNAYVTTASLSDYVLASTNDTISGSKTFTANIVANGNIGVGTATPYSKLSNTAGNTLGSDGSGGNPRSFSWAATEEGYVGQFYNGDSVGAYNNGLVVKVASASSTALDVSRGTTQNVPGTSLLTVKSNGNVGIGTSTPFSQLSNTSVNTSGSDGAGGNPGSFSWAATQEGYVGQFYNGDSVGNNKSGLVVKVASAASTALDVSQGTSQSEPGNSLLIVKSDGKVGIGTSSPSQKLDVIGTVKATSFTGDGATLAGIVHSSGNETINGVKTFSTTLIASGNVGIGTPSPSQKLDVIGTVKATSFTGNGSALSGVVTLAGNDTINGVKTFSSTLVANGNVGIGTNTPFSQLSNTSINTSGSDGAGGNPGSFSWAATQEGYVGQFYNGDSVGVNKNGLVVKVASANSTALDVSRGISQNVPGTSLLTVKSNGNTGVGTNNPTTKLDVNGFTKLGSNGPAIKTLELNGTLPSVQGQTFIAHNLTDAKIMSVSAMATSGTDQIPAGFAFGSVLYGVYIYNGQIVLQTGNSTSSANVYNKPVRILIIYKE